MAITPSGAVSLKLDQLRNLVAACPAWQDWSDTTTVDQAKTKIHLVDLPPPADRKGYTPEELAALRPLVRIDEFEMDDRPGGGGFVLERTALGFFVPSGKLFLEFEDEVPEEDADDPAAAKLRFMNNVGAVLLDVADLGGGEGNYLSVHRIEKWDRFQRADVTQSDAMGDFWRVRYVVSHGI